MSLDKKHILQNKWVQSGGIVVAVLVCAVGFLYFEMSQNEVSIDASLVSAPTISLSSTTPGALQQTFVSEGDSVDANTVVAQVGTSLIKTKVKGIITAVQNNIGKNINPGEQVVAMIDPTQLRIVGTIDENKGLDRIQVGQQVTFTIDAFGGAQYHGLVDEISPVANASGLTFNISDKRATQQFSIKVRFDLAQNPNVKNGMSAKMTIFTK